MEAEKTIALLHDMLLARAFEERAAEEYTRGNIASFLHLYPGEEEAQHLLKHLEQHWQTQYNRKELHRRLNRVLPPIRQALARDSKEWLPVTISQLPNRSPPGWDWAHTSCKLMPCPPKMLRIQRMVRRLKRWKTPMVSPKSSPSTNFRSSGFCRPVTTSPA